MIIINNQPVKFNEALNPCHLDFLRYKQLVELGDVTNFQVRIGDCPLPDNPIINGGFATNLTGWLGSGWFHDNGKACSNSPSLTTLTQNNIVVSGNFYRVEITISDLTALDPTVPFSGTVAVRLGAASSGIITEDGSYVFFILSSGPQVKIQKLQQTSVCVDNISVQKINIDHIVAIFDENDVFITDLKVSDFIVAPIFITPQFTLLQDFLTGFIDWEDLAIPEGCYKICLLDSCINTNFQNYLPNGEFDIDDQSAFNPWTIIGPGLFDIDGQQQLVFFGNSLDTGRLAQSGVKIGCTYEVEIKVVSMVNCEMFVRLGTDETVHHSVAGTFTENLTADNAIVSVRFVGTGGIPVGRIEYVRLRMKPACYEPDFCSTIFNLKADHPCTLRANGSNDPRVTDDFGFLFKLTNFNPTIRLLSKLVGSQYIFDIEKEEDSEGEDKLVFYQRVKSKKWRIERQPEYVHDFLSLIYGLDHFFIGAIEYSVQSEELPLAYDKEDNVTRTIIELREKRQLTRNTLCLSEGNDGGHPLEATNLTEPGGPIIIVEPGGPSEVITPG